MLTFYTLVIRRSLSDTSREAYSGPPGASRDASSGPPDAYREAIVDVRDALLVTNWGNQFVTDRPRIRD